MTLIASFHVDGLPCVISDCMISRQATPGAEFQSPLLGRVSIGSEAEISHAQTFPVGLTQKLLLCGTELAIAWAGRESVAREVLSELSENHSLEPYTPKSLESFFLRLPEPVFEEICLVGQLMHSRKGNQAKIEGFCLGNNVASLPTSNFGKTHSAGSGTKYFHFALSEIATVGDIDFLEMPPDPSQVGSAITFCKLMGLVGNLLSSEFVDPAGTIEQCFGGVYELATITDKSFKKLTDDIVYVFWSIELNSRNEISGVDKVFPVQAVHMTYDGDLVVARPVFSVDESGKLGDSLFILPPVDRDPSAEVRSKIVKPSFNSLYTMHIIRFVQNNEVLKAGMHFFERHEVKSKYFRISEKGKELVVSVNQFFIEYLNTRVRERASFSAKEED